VSRLVLFAVSCLVVGVILMVVLDIIWLGVPLLFAFVIAGVFAIADPAFLAPDDDAQQP
jgi:hypothetical protein